MISFEIGIDVVALFLAAMGGYIDLVRRVSHIEGKLRGVE